MSNSDDVIDKAMPWYPKAVEDFVLMRKQDGCGELYSDPNDAHRLLHVSNLEDEPVKIYRYKYIVDGVLVNHRFGGFAYYAYDYEKEKIIFGRYYLYDKEFKPANYWRLLSVMEQDVLKTTTTKTGMKFETRNGMPSPSIVYKNDKLLWRLNGQRCGMYEYLTYMERWRYSAIKVKHAYE